MFIVHVHCSLFMFIVHCSHGATLIFDDVFRCASISCTDDRISDSVIETVDWQSLMFDSYFTIRLV